jgi:hypothetical protein
LKGFLCTASPEASLSTRTHHIIQFGALSYCSNSAHLAGYSYRAMRINYSGLTLLLAELTGEFTAASPELPNLSPAIKSIARAKNSMQKLHASSRLARAATAAMPPLPVFRKGRKLFTTGCAPSAPQNPNHPACKAEPLGHHRNYISQQGVAQSRVLARSSARPGLWRYAAVG